jgi:hypothetical protein
LVENTAPTESHEELISTVSSASGDLVQVDRVDPATVESRPFSDEEYAVLNSDPYATLAIDPYGYEYVYYQGMSDYAEALGLGAASATSYTFDDYAEECQIIRKSG